MLQNDDSLQVFSYNTLHSAMMAIFPVASSQCQEVSHML